MRTETTPISLTSVTSDPDFMIMGLTALLIGAILLVFMRSEVGAIALMACVVGALLAV